MQNDPVTPPFFCGQKVMAVKVTTFVFIKFYRKLFNIELITIELENRLLLILLHAFIQLQSTCCAFGT